MTNPTLERAEKALRDEVERQVQAQGSYSGPENEQPDYVDAYLDYPSLLRAVLMAVRQTNEEMFLKKEGLRGGDWYTDGRSAAFMDMIDAILAEGE